MKNLQFIKKFLPTLKPKYTAHLYFSRILEELRLNSPFSEIFLNKVNKKDAPTYYDVIKYPMDLNTMSKKIHYYTLETFIYDLNLIWNNCFTFNSGVDYYINCAQRMKIKSDSLIEYYFNEKIGTKFGSTLCIGKNDFIFDTFMIYEDKRMFPYLHNKYVFNVISNLIVKELVSKKIKRCKKELIYLLTDGIIFLILKELKEIDLSMF